MSRGAAAKSNVIWYVFAPGYVMIIGFKYIFSWYHVIIKLPDIG